MINYQLIPVFADFFWSPETKMLYYESGLPVGRSTYERPLSKNPWYNFWSPPRYLNPSMYATDITAMTVKLWAKERFPSLDFSMEYPAVTGDVSHPMFLLVVSNGQKSERYNAGMIAFARDKNGEQAAYVSFDAELRLARILS
jgi:hypothetical protein